jgi:lysophospholipase L1-like esterase
MGRTHSRVVYAALGDSLSIDDYAGGPGRGAASLLWRNGDDDFPAWAGRDLTAQDPTARLVLLASDGATSAMVAGEQLGRLRRLGLTPTLATVTMGGNDLLAAYGDASATRRAIGTVVDNGRLVLASLRTLMGSEAPILVATVYDPSDGSGDAARRDRPHHRRPGPLPGPHHGRRGGGERDRLSELVRLGCDLAQGYHISKPLPAEQLTGWLQARIQPQPTRPDVAPVMGTPS